MSLYTLVSCLVLGTTFSMIGAQAPSKNKLLLAEKTSIPITLAYRTILGQQYQFFICQLYLGDKGPSSGVQKADFSIEFNGEEFVAPIYDSTCPAGLNATSEFGFIRTTTAPTNFESRGEQYTLLEHMTWVRLNLKQDVVNSPKSSLSINNDSAKWVKNQNNEFGVLNLGLGSRFFETLINTYRPEDPSADRIPVSWSLLPLQYDNLFDSSVKYYMDGEFVLNGYRSYSKQYGMKSDYHKGRWFYSGMDFRMGSKWTLYDRRVCLDPNADTFIGLPVAEYQKVWSIIQEDICSGTPADKCDYSKADLAKMTLLEASLHTFTIDHTQPSARFDSHVSLSGSDVIKKDRQGNYLRLGVVDSSTLRSRCEATDIVLGKWFFTKVELTLWVSTRSTRDVLLSLSPVAKQYHNELARVESFLYGLVFGTLFLIVGGIVKVCQWCRKKLRPAESENDEYQDCTVQSFDKGYK